MNRQDDVECAWRGDVISERRQCGRCNRWWGLANDRFRRSRKVQCSRQGFRIGADASKRGVVRGQLQPDFWIIQELDRFEGLPPSPCRLVTQIETPSRESGARPYFGELAPHARFRVFS